ncbi:MAG: alkaline phosphatase family protein [Acidobacteria bacterium]|nr:alkaline phosphatase family protein [Acidobacteriota bacterium]
MSEKLLVIGLDGVAFNWLDQLMADGHCPTLARLIRAGVRAELESTFPPITAVAWTSLATGKNPGKHGIFEFIFAHKGNRRTAVANASARDGEALWEILSRAGRRVIVTNFPCTYPPALFNGIMVADFMTPRGRRDFTCPRELLSELEERLGPYRLYLTQTYAPGNVAPVIAELLDEVRYKSRVNCYLMRRNEWDVFITHIWGTDRIQHELWHLLDPEHPRYDEEESKTYRHLIDQYWEEIDEQVSNMLNEAGESTSVWIISDHGFGPVHKYCSFNLWLLDQGLLKFKGDVLSRIKRWLFKLGMTPELAYRVTRHWLFAGIRPSRGVMTQAGSAGLLSKLFLSFADVDWSRTAAYSKGNYGQIFVNLKGRESQGVVERGEEYCRVRAEIIDRLRILVDPGTGEKLIGPIWTKEELYRGPHLDEAPDICFLPRDMRFLALGNADFNSNRFITGAFGNSGGHRMNGILIARGYHLRSGMALEPVRIYDVLPTLLHQLGLEIPDDLDGRVITEAFDPEFLPLYPVRFRRATRESSSLPEVEFSPEEETEIEARLKSLGYLG